MATTSLPATRVPASHEEAKALRRASRNKLLKLLIAAARAAEEDRAEDIRLENISAAHRWGRVNLAPMPQTLQNALLRFGPNRAGLDVWLGELRLAGEWSEE